MPQIEVCFSPALFPFVTNTADKITVVIDVLRATTSFCTAFDYGVDAIIPVESLDLARKYKEESKLVAAESDGLKPDFADFGNSAFDFMDEALSGKTIYYTTTNGTKAINMASANSTVAIASFLNLPAVSKWLINQNKNVVLLCAGWKNTFCIEDTLCAGAITELLLMNPAFESTGDSTLTALELWHNWSTNPGEIIKQSSHFKRLQMLGYDDILDYSLKIGQSKAIPVLVDDRIIDLAKKNYNKSV